MVKLDHLIANSHSFVSRPSLPVNCVLQNNAQNLIKNSQDKVAGVQVMEPTWITTVLLVPCVVVLTAGLFYLYGAVIGLLSKTSVRNKVVVITDALSGLGKGSAATFPGTFVLQRPHVRVVSPVPVAECSAVFHKGGARLILCGKSWEKLEELADDLEKTSDPTKVRG